MLPQRWSAAERSAARHARGQTFLIYLNDVRRGGTTCFETLGLELTPTRGRGRSAGRRRPCRGGARRLVGQAILLAEALRKGAHLEVRDRVVAVGLVDAAEEARDVCGARDGSSSESSASPTRNHSPLAWKLSPTRPRHSRTARPRASRAPPSPTSVVANRRVACAREAVP